MSYTLSQIKDESKKENICRAILETLPEWFGIPKAIDEYCFRSKKYIFIAAKDKEKNIGFLVLKKNTPFSFEIYVMGVLKEYQRQGVGKSSINHAVNLIEGKSVQYLIVKTLDESAESKDYEKTRMFYLNNGFIPVGVVKEEWEEKNPCLIMVKRLI